MDERFWRVEQNQQLTSSRVHTQQEVLKHIDLRVTPNENLDDAASQYTGATRTPEHPQAFQSPLMVIRGGDGIHKLPREDRRLRRSMSHYSHKRDMSRAKDQPPTTLGGIHSQKT